MVLQYAALAILQAESGSVSLVVRDQAYLAQAYQFLMLPGTAGIALDPKGKVRHYLFEAIRSIANEEDHSYPEEQQSLIVSLQNIPPHSSTVLDSIKDVPIRL